MNTRKTSNHISIGRKMRRRLVSILVTIAMVVGLLPVTKTESVYAGEIQRISMYPEGVARLYRHWFLINEGYEIDRIEAIDLCSLESENGWGYCEVTGIRKVGRTTNNDINEAAIRGYCCRQIVHVYAYFKKSTAYTITYASAGNGTVSRSSDTVYSSGGTINGSTATANPDSEFIGWYKGDTLVTTNHKLEQTDIDKYAKSGTSYVATTFTAKFQKLPTTITPTTTTGGTVSPTTAISIPNDGTTVSGTLEAVAEQGYEFDSWVIKESGTTDVSLPALQKASLTYAELKSALTAGKSYTFEAQFRSTQITSDWVKENTALSAITNVTDSSGGSLDATKVTGTGGTIEYTTDGVKITPASGYYAGAQGSHSVKSGDTNVPATTPTIAYTRNTDGSISITNDELVTWAKQYYNATNDPIYSGVSHLTLNGLFTTDSDVIFTYQSADSTKGTVTNTTGDTVKAYSGTTTGSTAQPKAGYKFDKWTAAYDATPVSTEATLTEAAIKAYMTEKYAGKNTTTTFNAHFVEDVDNTVDLKFVVLDSNDKTDGGHLEHKDDSTARTSITQTVKPISGGQKDILAKETKGYKFTGWSIKQDGETTTQTHSALTITADEIKGYAQKDGAYVATTFTATFEPIKVTLHADVNSSTMGSTNPKTQSVDAIATTSDTFTASPEPGYHFVEWQTATGTKIEGVTVAADGTATLSAQQIAQYAKSDGLYQDGYTFKAIFEENDPVTFTYQVSETMGRITDGEASESVAPATGTPKGITVEARPGYRFINWTTQYKGQKKEVSADEKLEASEMKFYSENAQGIKQATTFTANFTELEKVTLTFGSGTNGKIQVSGKAEATTDTQAISPATGKVSDLVSVTAVPDSGYRFEKWVAVVDSDEQTIDSEAELAAETISTYALDTTNNIYRTTQFRADFVREDDVVIRYEVQDGGDVDGRHVGAGHVLPTSEPVNPAIGNATGATATAHAGYEIDYWKVTVGTTTTTIPNSRSLTLDKTIVDTYAKVGGRYVDATFTAVFKEKSDVALTFTAKVGDETKGGLLTSSAQTTGIASITQTLSPATDVAVDVHATASKGYTFGGWYVGTTKVSEHETLTKDIIDQYAKSEAVGETRAYVATDFVAKFSETQATFTFTNEQPSMGSLDNASYQVDAVGGSSQIVAVTASPKAGYEFVGWYDGNGARITQAQTLSTDDIHTKAYRSDATGTAYEDTTFTARFRAKGTITLTYVVDTEMGSITSGGTQSILPTSTPDPITIEARPGYRFTGWTVNGQSIPADKTTLDVTTIAQYAQTEAGADGTKAYENTTFTANFVEKTHVTLSYTAGEHGCLTVEGTQVETYRRTINPETGQMPLATAQPDAGYHFSQWQVDGVKIDGATATLTKADIDKAARVGIDYVSKEFVAIFEEDPVVTINYRSVGQGTVSSSTEDVLPASGTPAGSTAQPDVGYELDGWYDETGTRVSTSTNFVPTRKGGLNVAATYEARFRRYSSTIDMGSEGSVLEIKSTLTGDVPSSYSESFAYSVVAGAGSPAISGSFVTEAFASSTSKYLTGASLTVDDVYTGATYTITQTAGTSPYVAYDGSEYEVTFDIVRNGLAYEVRDVAITQTKDRTGASISRSVSSIEFVNNYTVPTLVVTKTTDATYAKVGDLITYTITVENTGEVPASSATITDTIGDGVEYVSSSPSGSFSSPNVSWEGQSIGVGQTKTYTVTVRVTDDAGETITSGMASAVDSVTDARGQSTVDTASGIQVHKLPTQTTAYSASFARVTEATESSERDGIYGFIRGNLVEMDATITNDSSMTLSMDVTDAFLEGGVFSDIEIKSVTAAQYTSVATGVRVTIEPGEMATIRFAAQVKANIDNYDSEPLGTQGYTNEVTIANVVASTTLPDGTVVSYSRDGSVAGTSSWSGGDPLAETTVRTTVPTRIIDIMVTYSFDVNWADTVPTYRPVSVEVALVRTDTGEAVETKTLTAEDRTSSDVWSTVFSAQPAYANVIGLVEESGERYISGASGYTSDDSSSATEVATDSAKKVAGGDQTTGQKLEASDGASVDAGTADSESPAVDSTTHSSTDYAKSGETTQLATASDATASEASSERTDGEKTDSEYADDGTLLDGMISDDTVSDDETDVYESHSSRYTLSLASGLINIDDLGEPIEYAVEILSEVVEGYTRSEVTSVGEKFEVTESRPWTPREISTSGVPTKSGSSSGSGTGGSSTGGSNTSGSAANTSTSGSWGQGATGRAVAQSLSDSIGSGSSISGLGPIGAHPYAYIIGIPTGGTADGTSGASGSGTAAGVDGSGSTTGAGGTVADGTSRYGTWSLVGQSAQALASSLAADEGVQISTGATGTTITGLTSLAGIETIASDIRFTLADGSVLTNTWALLGSEVAGEYTYEWYHFASDGSLDTGWFLDSTGHWYYLSEEAGLGQMTIGWNLDSQDGRWYFLDGTTGAMLTGWNQIDSSWYYFTAGTPIETWEYNVLTRKWVYKHLEDDRPLGSMYAGESTPDGYEVSTSGVYQG